MPLNIPSTSLGALNLWQFAGENISRTPAAGDVLLQNSSGLWQNFTNSYNVKAFGAKGDLIADDGPSIRAAIAAAAPTGGIVFFPPGNYNINTGSLTVPAGISLRGSGACATSPWATQLRFLTTNTDGVILQGWGTGLFDLYIQYVPAPLPTSGVGIKISGGSFQMIERCRVQQFFNCIDCDSATDQSSFTIRDTCIQSPANYGIRVRNPLNADVGDSTITGCTIGGGTPAAQIRYESGGGLRAINNKILFGARGLDVQLADGATTSNLLFMLNSVEGQTTESIRTGRSGTTGHIGRLLIQNNEFAPAAGGITLGAGADQTIVQGNVVNNAGSGTVGVQVNSTTQTFIDGNFFIGYATGISLSANSDKPKVGSNYYHGCTVPIQDNTALALTRSGEQSHVINVVGNNSNSVYTNYYRVDLTIYQSCQIELVFNLLVGGIGPAARVIRKLVTVAGGNCTVTAVEDVASGAVIDVQFDNTTTAGTVYIGLKLNVAGGGTSLAGTISLRATSGHVYQVQLLSGG